MGKPQTPHFHDFGIFGRDSQNQILLFFEDPRTLQIIQEKPESFKTILWEYQNAGNRKFEKMKKAGPEIPKIRLIFFGILNMGAIFFAKHEMVIL